MTAQVPKLVRSILHASYSGEQSAYFAGLERNMADSRTLLKDHTLMNSAVDCVSNDQWNGTKDTRLVLQTDRGHSVSSCVCGSCRLGELAYDMAIQASDGALTAMLDSSFVGMRYTVGALYVCTCY